MNRGYRPDVGLLNDRLETLTEHYYKEKRGVAEFKWGIDYTPNMIPECALEIDERMFDGRNKLSLFMEKDAKYLDSVKKLVTKVNTSENEEDSDIAKVELN